MTQHLDRLVSLVEIQTGAEEIGEDNEPVGWEAGDPLEMTFGDVRRARAELDLMIAELDLTAPHSTWEGEAKASRPIISQLQEANTELALQALSSIGQAAEAYEAQLIAEAEAEGLRARVADLEAALDSEHSSVGHNIWRFWSAKARDLATRNTELRARVTTLEAGLEPFSKFAGELFARNCNKGQIVVAMNTSETTNILTFDDFLEARAALQQETKP